MLISYPILPADAVNQSEQAKFDAMLELTQKDRGLYPVTTGNRWHGGIHLTPGDEPIRAIADGVIVAYRLASASKDYRGQGSYDTSFVLIRHETDSGENTRVVFYSLYMHLKPKGLLSTTQRDQLAKCLSNASVRDNAVQAPADMKVWRKEVLGFGGVLYGRPTVHFEIFATEEDFGKFWRDRTTIQPGQHGSDDVFGNMHFVIPANRQFSERHPQAVAPHRIKFKNENKFFELDTGQAGQNTQRLHVVVELDKGKRTATTYSLDEQGRVTCQIGTPVVQQDYEYELYRLATALYADCPSAGFEYLRFGRILGPDTTTQVENWQLIRYSETAMGYINLADPANQVSVLSDADFPLHWQTLQEGSAASPSDGIANVAELTNRLQLPEQPSGASLFAPPEFAARANAAGAAKALRHFICKHPSEWDASDLDARYAALRQAGKPLQDQAAWDNFKKHVEAMAFWHQSGIQDRSVWHFHPLEFIRHYRKCLWLSKNELIRVYPESKYPLSTLALEGRGRTPESIRETYREELNKVTRKYLVITQARLSHFYGQAAVESLFLCLMAEGAANFSTNPSHASFQPETNGFYNPTRPNYLFYLENKLGNIEPGDGPKFRGRGLKQLTGRENYSKYWVYRGWINLATFRNTWWNPPRPELAPNIPDPQRISTNSYNAIDAGGWYWQAGSARNNFKTINKAIPEEEINRDNVRRVSAAINGINPITREPNDLDRRIEETKASSIILTDNI